MRVELNVDVEFGSLLEFDVYEVDVRNGVTIGGFIELEAQERVDINSRK